MPNSAICKAELVKWCKANLQEINKGFCAPFTQQEIKDIMNVNKWKRMNKNVEVNDYTTLAEIQAVSDPILRSILIMNRKCSGHLPPKYIERGFDNIGFDACLRGYVITDINDVNILDCYAHGE